MNSLELPDNLERVVKSLFDGVVCNRPFFRYLAHDPGREAVT
jgi:hypothetical protein